MVSMPFLGADLLQEECMGVENALDPNGAAELALYRFIVRYRMLHNRVPSRSTRTPNMPALRHTFRPSIYRGYGQLGKNSGVP